MVVMWRECGCWVEEVWLPGGGSVVAGWRECGCQVEGVWLPGYKSFTQNSYLMSTLHFCVIFVFYSVLKRDARCILLFSLHFYGQEFNISFPSEQLRQL